MKQPDSGGRRRLHAKAVEASLKRLRTDWIDLYQVHFPDPKTSIAETLRALDNLVRQGKVRHIGSSNSPRNRSTTRRRGYKPQARYVCHQPG